MSMIISFFSEVVSQIKAIFDLLGSNPIFYIIIVVILYFRLKSLQKKRNGYSGNYKLYMETTGNERHADFIPRQIVKTFDIVTGELHPALLAEGTGRSSGVLIQIDSIPNNSPVAQKGAHHVYVPEDVYTILATDTHKHHPISFAIGADGVPLAVLPPVYND